MEELFVGINMTWKKVILFAIICGVYTGVMTLIPATKDTSFRDISISFEWWILFAILIIAAASVYGFLDQRSHTYDTSLLASGSETCGIEYDDSYKVYLEDPSFGEVRIGYEEPIDSYLIYASFTKTGDTVLVLESPDGETYSYDISIGRDTYDIHRRSP